jgi:hypothetical protein
MDPKPKDPAVAGLEALGGMAAEVDKDNQGPEAAAKKQQDQQQADVALKQAREWGMIPYTLGGLFVMIDERLRSVYTEERCVEWGRHMAATAKKYGWDSPSNIPELGLIACSISFALPTAILVRQRVQQAKEAKDGSVFARVVLWWQMRKASRAQQKQAAEAQAAPAAQGGGDGGQQ